MPLLTLSKNRLTGHLYFSDVIAMKKGLIDALEIAVNEVEKGLSTPKNISIELRDVHDGEVTEERKAALKAELDNIEGIPQKIKYLQIAILEYQANASGLINEVSGRAIGSGYPNVKFFWDKYLEKQIEILKLQSEGPIILIENLIKPELIDGRLVEVEYKLKDKIEDWKIGKDKIGCAAFCEMLFEKGYFFKTITERKGPIQFALIRYGIDITVQMGTTKNKDRQLHKGKLKRYFA
ncbi:MAG: hypothetical protein B7Y11_04990 [Sphingobacteriia bacterium 24-36-13]|jgi:hypothetical protein|uniref:hypothetical protein n=1 Tax=Sediminibacterium sp. TaxID=1917865 RepID=UPI000BDCBE3F|nr:hypothetical protein [Sediminibacterium sp.]OYZ54483.1 MAG: hypothetical protein B7Y11_04990 [Sphingobacteriia bacterium 24-36-13]OZA65496.1 MAG: hypothetical protein B7X68_03925 [Sphingobacteriia bacterium 39-36-14]HQS23880.1 hypothetical protein [Sediminibacterium sp.]HQS34446.1 hypothetical protein [Sediminibacterium sp.]